MSHDVRMDVEELVGAFVVEVGVRQAWPFLGFCDNRGVQSEESRLTLDTSWSIGDEHGAELDSQRWLLAADALNGLTVSQVTVESDGALHLGFADGPVLRVSAETSAESTGVPWWLARQR